jgi:peptide deformylase
MSVLEIKCYPDEVLKKKSLPVEKVDDNLRRLIRDMLETLHSAPGVGLAAPQVGVSKRLVVLDTSAGEEKFTSMVLINPEIMDTEGIMDSEEGCLSLPKYTTNLKRAKKILVKALDSDGNPVEFCATDLLARIVQHEIDHLDGLLIVDRISSIKREFFRKRYKKTVMAEI